MAGVPEPGRERGVYGITVAAELVGTGVQNLRSYEARGLLEPERTAGGTRRYSADDLDRLRRIGDLLAAGLNLAGISMVLNLEAQNTKLRARTTTATGHRPAEPNQQAPPVNPSTQALHTADRSPSGTPSLHRRTDTTKRLNELGTDSADRYGAL